MKIKGIIFDVYGTLIDIQTDEGYEEIYRAISHFLTYHGIYMHRWEVRDAYYRIMEEQRKASFEEHFEFDALELWQQFLNRNSNDPDLPGARTRDLALFLAEMYRGISRQRLQLYPGVREMLDELRPFYSMAAVSDAQRPWVVPEMQATGIYPYFSPVVISGDFGFRKPDRRMFETVLSGLELDPGEVIFVGNDMYRDIHGAAQAGMNTVFFSSNQGRKEMEGVEPDYIIYDFLQLRQAIGFFEGQ
ncbi:MAG: HAD family hydrolase [Deltaproteobacteria bacterium]|nr:HAD family hydrolase [Deltaproteobacteria bacterium]